MSRFLTCGIDLVEYGRAREFYRNCRDCLDEFLSRAEISFVQDSRRPHEALAVLLAAKEAVFKALGLSWMGLLGFKAIRIVPSAGSGPMSFVLGGHLKSALARNTPRRLFLKKTKTYAVVGFYSCAGLS